MNFTSPCGYDVSPPGRGGFLFLLKSYDLPAEGFAGKRLHLAKSAPALRSRVQSAVRGYSIVRNLQVLPASKRSFGHI